MQPTPDRAPLPAAPFNLLGELLEEHRPRLLAVVRRRLDPALSPRLDAEEVLQEGSRTESCAVSPPNKDLRRMCERFHAPSQEVFLRARDRWAAFRERPAVTPYAWLYGLTRDCLIEAWRREAREGRALRSEVPWPPWTPVDFPGASSPGGLSGRVGSACPQG
jgi:DNA-directed RNA polymerase specialized sigma24 family protein